MGPIHTDKHRHPPLGGVLLSMYRHEWRKVFWGNCLSKTLCKSQPDRHIQKRGGIGKISPIHGQLFGLGRVP
jgi:hypothetical protein